MSTQHGYGPVVNGTQIVFYEYRPNKAAGFVFVALFGAVTVAQILSSLIILRAWHFIPFILGGICETFGYYGRAASASDPAKAGPFVLQTILLLVAAPLLAASIYMTAGRTIIALDGQHHSWVSPRWMTKTYVFVDIACILTQFMGAGLMTSKDMSKIAESKALIVGGLLTQLIAVTAFIFSCGYVHYRLRLACVVVSLRWERVFIAIEIAAVLLLVRSIVRAFEYLQGSGGFVVSHEIFVYAFDAMPMWIIMTLLLAFQPQRVVQEVRRLKGNGVWDDEHVLLVDRSSG
ncbi:RTA1 like protein-domain-containing protein [Aspergillus pseudotamarii]|uniref:RTA1 like protein-domain-containing protein n=1 Tax=Aspergillus pseudotamarii TaxID=132259 RepID=A0A5N6STM9_ASPPS|nr:RTA1 like protein-domain-containing protein [Aspergillus pseudotamarii]KAE8137141.1 RTA1 like protein-domain-containing protein [Aspergillus pseudotamarii]